MTLGMTSQELETFVPVYNTIPDQWVDAKPFFVEVLKKMSNAINIRTIGWLLDEELLSGQSFIPGATIPGNNPGQFRSVLRKVVDCGTLPNAGTSSTPHGIQYDSNFTLINLWAVATDPINLQSFVIPHATVVPANTVQIFLDNVNINISDLINYSTFTRVFCFIEYIQEV
jgi:hypothetical protein